MFYSKKLVLFLLFVFFFTVILYPFSASAQISSLYSYSYSGIKPFGGRIISMQPCVTPPGIMLNIGGPMGGQFLLADSSQVFDYGVFANGVWKLGTAESSTVTCKGKKGVYLSRMGIGGAQLVLTGVQTYKGISTGFANAEGLSLSGEVGREAFQEGFQAGFENIGAIPGTDVVVNFSQVFGGLQIVSGAIGFSEAPVSSTLQIGSGIAIMAGAGGIGIALAVASFVSKLALKEKKLDTLGHPHVIKMVGTSLTP